MPTVVREKERGFSLIEILMVIVIIGILAAAAVFAVGGITDRGQSTACSADSHNMLTAIEAYHARFEIAGDPTESELHTEGFLAAESTLHDIGGSGDIVPVAGGPCD